MEICFLMNKNHIDIKNIQKVTKKLTELKKKCFQDFNILQISTSMILK